MASKRGNALVICNHGPYGAGDSGGIAGLKYQDFTFEVSRQCRGKAGLLIPVKTAGEIAGRFDRVLPVYSTMFYPNFSRVLKYREIRYFEIKFPFKRGQSSAFEKWSGHETSKTFYEWRRHKGGEHERGHSPSRKGGFGISPEKI